MLINYLLFIYVNNKNQIKILKIYIRTEFLKIIQEK